MSGWKDLEAELALWLAPPTCWWRDDDAAGPSAALDRLVAVSGAAPIGLATVPASVKPGLDAEPRLTILQHGWSHTNHAPIGERAAEFGATRPWDERRRELEEGRARLADLYGPRFLAVLVPPWNRFDPEMLERLPALGYRGFSAFKPRNAVPAGLAIVNAHVDPIAWKKDRRFVGEAKALGELVGHLEARRTGTADREEPTGLLTHHLVHDEELWAFLADLARFPGLDWITPAQAFSGPRAAAR